MARCRSICTSCNVERRRSKSTRAWHANISAIHSRRRSMRLSSSQDHDAFWSIRERERSSAPDLQGRDPLSVRYDELPILGYTIRTIVDDVEHVVGQL